MLVAFYPRFQYGWFDVPFKGKFRKKNTYCPFLSHLKDFLDGIKHILNIIKPHFWRLISPLTMFSQAMNPTARPDMKPTPSPSAPP